MRTERNNTKHSAHDTAQRQQRKQEKRTSYDSNNSNNISLKWFISCVMRALFINSLLFSSFSLSLSLQMLDSL